MTVASGAAAWASTTDELMLVSGSTSVTVVDNGPLDWNKADGGINYYNNNLNGWTVSFVSGVSHSPGLDGLGLSSLTAVCYTGDCSSQPLEIWLSDTNFTAPLGVGGLVTTFSTTQTGDGRASESAWYSKENTTFDPQNLIGTLGPFRISSFGSAALGSASSSDTYSLTMQEVFTDSGGGPVSFSANGNITAAPEPTAIVLFGTVLLLCAGALRHRKR